MPPVLIPAIVRFHRIAPLEVVPGVQVLVAKKFEHVAAKGIGARFRREIDHAAIEPPELGRRAVALDLELLDGVDDRIVRELPRLGLQHGDAVEEILIGSRSPAVDARQEGVRRQRDARSNGREHDEQAAVQRQLHHLLVLDDGPEARGLRPHDRRVEGHDRHLFSNVSDAEIEIDPRLFTGRDANALAAHGLEPRELDVEPVLAGRQARGGVNAVARGHHYSLQVRPCLRDRDRRAGNGSPGLIVHKTGDLAGSRLGMCGRRPHTCDKPQARACPTPTFEHPDPLA